MEQPTPQQIANFENRYFRADFIERKGATFVSWKRLDKVLARLRTHILDAILPAVANQLVPMRKRIKELEKTVADLQAQKSFNLADVFKGVWMPGTTFARGSLAVWDGSLWLSLVDTEQKPGASVEWKMVTKKGRDGKDLRA